MTPWRKFWLKSISVFVAAIAVTGGLQHLSGQISLYDWLALLWPGIAAVAGYWGFVADSTPAPWSKEQKAIDAARQTP